MRKIFLSFSHRDVVMRDNLEGLFAARRGPIEGTPTYLKEDKRPEGEAAIVQAIKRTMEGCCGVLLVIGQDVHNSEWIKYELQVADSWGLPRLGIEHPQSRWGPPNSFPRLKILKWDPQAIAKEVNGWKAPEKQS